MKKKKISLPTFSKFPGVSYISRQPRNVKIATGCGLAIGVVGTLLVLWLSASAASAFQGVVYGGSRFTSAETRWARDRTWRAVAGLDRFLSHSWNGPGWQRYLRTHDLRGELANRQPDAERLEKHLDLFQQDHEGLELPEFARVRTALSMYLKVLRNSDPDDEPEVETARLAVPIRRY